MVRVTSEYRSVCLGSAEIKAGDLFFVGFWLASTTREYLIKDITFVSSSGATLSAVLA